MGIFEAMLRDLWRALRNLVLVLVLLVLLSWAVISYLTYLVVFDG